MHIYRLGRVNNLHLIGIFEIFDRGANLCRVADQQAPQVRVARQCLGQTGHGSSHTVVATHHIYS